MLGALKICISAILLLRNLVLAAPTVEGRSVSSTDLQNFNLFEQYSCAAYNSKNFQQNGTPPTGTAISCQPSKCPLVQAAKTTLLTEFAIPGIIVEDDADATGFVAVDETNHLVVLSFRGSVTASNWITNAQIEFYQTELCDNCQAHLGFWHSWISVRSQVLDTLTAGNLFPSHKLIVTGHSLGGAIATLAISELRYLGYNATLYTFGAPMAGNQELATYISNQPGGNYRITHFNDPVPLLPPPSLGFAHTAPEYWISSGNNDPVVPDVVHYFPRGRGTSEIDLLTVDTDDHLWYFGEITAC
ncbi:MAG: hypothetical protein M1840_001738 [Geoglossum simile]|nr:MAG: hypothetical protein M1840_001738 [Geoglossum simile]